MRYLIAAAVLMASPAFAGPRCYDPPGSPSGTARWLSRGMLIETYLTTSNGDRYTCGPNIKRNEPSMLPGSTGYFKQICGPLTIVQKEFYRECTFEESVGVSEDEISSYRCKISKILSGAEITFDTKYELRDKDGQAFSLWLPTDETSDSCTSHTKTEFYTKTWRVEASKISLTTVTEYQAESIKQPSL